MDRIILIHGAESKGLTHPPTVRAGRPRPFRRLLCVPRSLFVGGQPNVPVVKNGCASEPDQRGEIAARQKQNVVEYVRRNQRRTRTV
jgi:hypothetical protein